MKWPLYRGGFLSWVAFIGYRGCTLLCNWSPGPVLAMYIAPTSWLWSIAQLKHGWFQMCNYSQDNLLWQTGIQSWIFLALGGIILFMHLSDASEETSQHLHSSSTTMLKSFFAPQIPSSCPNIQCTIHRKTIDAKCAPSTGPLCIHFLQKPTGVEAESSIVESSQVEVSTRFIYTTKGAGPRQCKSHREL